MSFRRFCIALAAGVLVASSGFAEDTTNKQNNPASGNPEIVIPSGDAQNAAAASDQTTEEKKVAVTEGAATDLKKINLNQANAKELGKIKGMSAYRARQVVAHRKKHGDFTTLDSLKSVKGFSKLSDDQLKQIQDQLTLE